MRKAASSLDEQRTQIKKVYMRGKKQNGGSIRGLDELGEIELAVVRESACFYKAAGYPHSYIAEALDLSVAQVRKMFKEDPAMVANVQKISQNLVDGAAKLLRTYAVELVEMLVEIARTTLDEKIAVQCIIEALDRIGLTKVSKSDSVVTNKSQIEFTDTTGLVERTRNAPPEVQQAMAKHAESIVSLLGEHGELAPETVEHTEEVAA